MKNWSLRTKFIIGFAIPVVMLIATIGLSAFTGMTADNLFYEINDFSVPVITALEEMKFAGSRLISSANELVLDEVLNSEIGEDAEADEESNESEQITQAIEGLEFALENYQSVLTNHPEHLEEYTSVNHIFGVQVEELTSAADTLLDLREAGVSVEELSEGREAFEEAEVTFFANLDTVIEHERAELTESQTTFNTLIRTIGIVGTGFGWFAIVTSATLVTFIYRSITRPLGKLKATADALRNGQMDARTDLTSNDELGQLGQTLNTMADYLSDSMKTLTETAAEAQTARSRAEQADQVKSAFLASMSHELRTPLNSVINYTKFVIKGVMGPVTEKQVETLTKVADSGKHLLSLINDVLDISKIESGSLSLFIEENVDLAELMRTTASTAESLLEGKPVKVNLELPSELPLVRGDKQRLRQIMLNIASNACKFTEEGHIIIAARMQVNEIVLSIEDTGPGIRPEDRAAVFEPFKQTETGLRQGAGTGLGMPISKSLAEAHGGRLWFKSTPGSGSTFYVALPVKSESLVPTLA